MLFDAVLEGFMVVIYDGDCYLMFCTVQEKNTLPALAMLPSAI